MAVFALLYLSDIEKITQELYIHFKKFSIQMHVGSGNEGPKTIAMYFHQLWKRCHGLKRTRYYHLISSMTKI